VAVALEQSCGALIFMLGKYEHPSGIWTSQLAGKVCACWRRCKRVVVRVPVP
jgi:hypothetical protein